MGLKPDVKQAARQALTHPPAKPTGGLGRQTVKSATMEQERWTPHVTVAAVVERDGRFLVVEECTPDGLRINQPAGHLEAGETLVEAVMRETLEETAHAFQPEALIGAYMAYMDKPGSGATYLRFTFCGSGSAGFEARELDEGIVRVLWLTADELRACRARHRTPLVLRSIEDYLAGRRFPLDFVRTHSVGPPARNSVDWQPLAPIRIDQR